jgi:hypothetical protein
MLTSSKKRNQVVSAVEALASKVSEAKQTALLKQTKEQIKALQVSLFDIAPWPDHMRALPNDYARSALFTVRNKRTPREAVQNQVLFHVNKDVPSPTPASSCAPRMTSSSGSRFSNTQSAFRSVCRFFTF